MVFAAIASSARGVPVAPARCAALPKRAADPTAIRPPELLGPRSLDRLPAGVRRPGYDRAALGLGMAHLGVGAFHRCHQAEFTDDMLEAGFDRWGVVGINLRPPALAETLGAQDGLYTRVLRSGDRTEARVIGCLRRVVDSQGSPGPALAVLADPAIDVVTITVTEKGYCHRPAERRARPRPSRHRATTSRTPRRRAACPASSPAPSSCAG